MSTPEALMHAIRNEDLDAVQRAIADGADVNARIPQYTSPSSGIYHHNVTPLFAAIDGRQVLIAKWLIANTDVDCLALIGRTTPLHLAATKNLITVVDEMGKRHVDLNALNEGRTALSLAFEHGLEWMAGTLLHHDANPNAGPRPAIFYAPESPKPALAQRLLDAGCYINAVSDNSMLYREDGWMRAWMVPLVEHHLQKIDETLACSPGDGFEQEKLIAKSGIATPLLDQIIGVGRLQDLFSNQRWQGREVEALLLYDKLASAVPSYLRADYKAIDLTGLNVAALEAYTPTTAVGRYVRSPQGERGLA